MEEWSDLGPARSCVEATVHNVVTLRRVLNVLESRAYGARAEIFLLWQSSCYQYFVDHECETPSDGFSKCFKHRLARATCEAFQRYQ